jgi:hypothetical protein
MAAFMTAPRFENQVCCMENLLCRPFGNLAAPRLDVASAEFGTGQPQRLAAEQCHAFCLNFPQISRCAVAAVVLTAFGCMPEHNMPEFME